MIFLKKRLLEESSRKHSWGRNYFKDKFKHRPRQRAVFEEVQDTQNLSTDSGELGLRVLAIAIYKILVTVEPHHKILLRNSFHPFPCFK